jgi:heme-degrading monooxygenase HmoA
MYLRVTAFKSDPSKLDAGVAFLREKIIPAMKQAPGFLGATCILNREEGTGAASTLWESLEAMNQAEQLGQQSRIQSSAATGLEVVDVDRFEITALEMSSPTPQVPSYTRVLLAYADPKKLDEVVKQVREQSIPLLKAQPGFRAFAAGVNRATGRGFTSSSFATAAQREASNATLADQRERITSGASMYGVQVQLVETVLAEIKLPVAR